MIVGRFHLWAWAMALVMSGPLCADDLKWGEPVNGLRIGVASTVTSITADQALTFKVVAENVSSQPIVLPTPDTFLLQKREDSDDYHVGPLSPVIEVAGAPPSEPLSWKYFNYSISQSGVKLGLVPKTTVTVAPGQTVSWNSIPLEQYSYDGTRLPADEKTSVQKWTLFPGRTFRISYRYENAQKQFAGVGVWTGKADSGPVEIEVKSPSLDGIKLEGQFTLPKLTYFIGEPIEATFTVTNKGDEAIQYPYGGDYRSTGRPDRFSVTATDEKGEAVPDPVTPGGLGGGLGSSIELKPGESHEDKLLLNRWRAFTKPGKYTITCKRTLNVIRSAERGPDYYSRPEQSMPAVPIETTFTIEVKDDPAALQAWLAAAVVALRIAAQDALGDLRGNLLCLSQAKNPAAFPVLVQLLDGGDSDQAFAVEALSHYDSDKAAPVLLEHYEHLSPQAKVWALDNLGRWHAPGIEHLVAEALRDPDHNLSWEALSLCTEAPYPSCVPILLTMTDDPKPDTRMYVARALGLSGDKRAIPALLRLLHEARGDPEVTMEAAAALGNFKRTEGVPVLIGLLNTPFSKDHDVVSAINNLTGQKFQNKKECLAWWEKEGRQRS
jgi:hypothetical protein